MSFVVKKRTFPFLYDSSMKGLIFDIRKYSVHDGPGIRVTFFMKGCPLNCLWCHNPEGILPMPQQVRIARKVGGREFLVNETAGTFYEPVDLVRILDREKVFISHSDGGVTFSGGEPLHQPEFLLESLELCKSNGYHTAVDTSGYSPAETFSQVITYTDLFLFDLKHLDDDKHMALTGVSNRLIIGNFHRAVKSGKDIFVRFPVIPGKNDDPEHLARLKNFFINTNAPNLRKICLLPFHTTGSSKYTRTGMTYSMAGTDQPSADRMDQLRDFFSETGIKVKTGG
jgi:pyruvate formate lyase activating enzyme